MPTFSNILIYCASYFIFTIILAIFAAYAYYVNTNRRDDDPEKKDYHTSGIFVLPFFWPLLLIIWIPFSLIKISLTLLLVLFKALFFGLLLVLFTLAIVFIRKPFWLIWLEKIALKIGTKLLDADAALRSFAFGWSTSNT